VPAQSQAEASVLIELEPRLLHGGKTPLSVGVYEGDHRLDVVQTVFVGPRDGTGAPPVNP
jgi:hypothetical protein